MTLLQTWIKSKVRFRNRFDISGVYPSRLAEDLILKYEEKKQQKAGFIFGKSMQELIVMLNPSCCN